jgi:hydrogenase maturation factor
MTEIAGKRCITCSDEAVEAVVVAVHGHEAIVQVAGHEERVAVDLVPDAAPGDLLLCHAGIALERLEQVGA